MSNQEARCQGVEIDRVVHQGKTFLLGNDAKMFTQNLAGKMIARLNHSLDLHNLGRSFPKTDFLSHQKEFILLFRDS